jgi:membrane protein YqaA with SNARE-associated domain
VAAFLAATLFPFYSEVILLGLAAKGGNPLTLWSVATLGNTLGSLCNWILGRYCLHYRDRRWFPFRQRELERAQQWFQRYGVWSLLFAWLPIGGDGLTFVAGLMRVHALPFVVLTGLGKGLRYAVLLMLL